jgi:hypothetical protein
MVVPYDVAIVLLVSNITREYTIVILLVGNITHGYT